MYPGNICGDTELETQTTRTHTLHVTSPSAIVLSLSRTHAHALFGWEWLQQRHATRHACLTSSTLLRPYINIHNAIMASHDSTLAGGVDATSHASPRQHTQQQRQQQHARVAMEREKEQYEKQMETMAAVSGACSIHEM